MTRFLTGVLTFRRLRLWAASIRYFYGPSPYTISDRITSGTWPPKEFR